MVRSRNSDTQKPTLDTETDQKGGREGLDTRADFLVAIDFEGTLHTGPSEMGVSTLDLRGLELVLNLGPACCRDLVRTEHYPCTDMKWKRNHWAFRFRQIAKFSSSQLPKIPKTVFLAGDSEDHAEKICWICVIPEECPGQSWGEPRPSDFGNDENKHWDESIDRWYSRHSGSSIRCPLTLFRMMHHSHVSWMTT